MMRLVALFVAVVWGTSLGGYLLRLQEVALWQLSLRNPRPSILELTALPSQIASDWDALWGAASVSVVLATGIVAWRSDNARSRLVVAIGASALVLIASAHLNVGTPQAASWTIELVTLQVVLLAFVTLAKRDYLSVPLLVCSLVAVWASHGASTGAGTMGTLQIRERQLLVPIGGVAAAILGVFFCAKSQHPSSRLVIVIQALSSVIWGHDALLRIGERLPPLDGRPLVSACEGRLSEAPILNLELLPDAEFETRLVVAVSRADIDGLVMLPQHGHVHLVEVVAQKLTSLGLWTAPLVSSAEHCAGCVLHPGSDGWADELARCHSMLKF